MHILHIFRYKIVSNKWSNLKIVQQAVNMAYAQLEKEFLE